MGVRQQVDFTTFIRDDHRRRTEPLLQISARSSQRCETNLWAKEIRADRGDAGVDCTGRCDETGEDDERFHSAILNACS